MVAPTHINLGFEDDGTGDPMSPAGWTGAVTATGEVQAGWDAPLVPEPWEDFEEGWGQVGTIGSALLVSAQEPYNITDQSVLELSAGGAAAELVVFDVGDFADITDASAAEVAAVIQAATTLTVETSAGRVVLKSNPFGDGVEVVGLSPANDALGFPRQLLALQPDGIGTEVAAFEGGASEAAEQFEAQWAGLAATLTSTNSGPFNLSNGDTLDVVVNNGPVQNVVLASVTVPGAATAAEIAADISAQVSGATATALDTEQVQIVNDFEGTGSQLNVTGGTVEAALLFIPSAGDSIAGNEGFFTVLPGSTAALWNGTDQAEAFETGFAGNGSFVWALTTDLVIVKSAIVGTYRVTLTTKDPGLTEVHEVETSAGDTTNQIAANLATTIDNDSALVSAADVGSNVELTRLDNRTEITITLEVLNSSGVAVADAMSVGSNSTSASLTAAQFDGATQDFEDYEDGWLNEPADGVESDEWLWNISDELIHVRAGLLNSTLTYTITVTVNRGGDDEIKTFASVNPPDVGTFNSDLQAAIDADPDFQASVVADGVAWSRVDSRLRIVSVVADEPTIVAVGATKDTTTTASVFTSFDFATFRNVGDFVIDFPFETFEVEPGDGPLSGVNVVYQHSVEVVNAQVGRYSIFINGHEFFYDAQGGDGVSTIASELRDAITTGGGPFRVEAVLQGPSQHVRIRSTTAPVTASEDIGVQTDAPDPNDLEASEPAVFEFDNWTWGAFLRTLP